MASFAITHPVASVARGIENLVIAGRNSKNLVMKGGCEAVSRLVSLTVFPIFLLLELVFKELPKLLFSVGNPDNFHKNADRIVTYLLALLFFPLGIHSPEGVSGFFLKTPSTPAVLPFGVEGIYGKKVDQVLYPRDREALREIVLQAKREQKQISVIGAGMSQGMQTVPEDHRQVVIHTKHLNQIRLAEDGQTVTVGSGATWEELQMALNRQGKSAIVKQASDIFSIGGSIAINCHGWAHESGAIASTVTSLEMIDAEGNFRTLTPQDELFGCMFGTLGYFGVVVSATLRVVDNEPLVQRTDEIDLDDFSTYYDQQIRGRGIPLFGGRLVLDHLSGNPLRRICMVRYERDPANQHLLPLQARKFSEEKSEGSRIERVALRLISHFSNFSVTRLLSFFWERERREMLQEKRLTRNEALHPPINAFKMLRHSHLHTQWLQEYFVTREHLASFLEFLGAQLKADDVRLINATIRPVPQDSISILPYAEQDRLAVVICFAQKKTERDIERTRRWIETVNQHLARNGDVYYQAYMPYATRAQFEKCYGEGRVARLRHLKAQYDPGHLFGNGHTAKYFDEERS